jgi:predicted ArsR family transcriptional regulator
MRPTAGKVRARVYAYVRDHGPVTDEQIARGLGLNPSTARPRRVELWRSGSIVEAGRGLTLAGRSARRWRAR